MTPIIFNMPQDLNSIEEIELLSKQLVDFGVSISLVTGTDREGIAWKIERVSTPRANIVHHVVDNLIENPQWSNEDYYQNLDRRIQEKLDIAIPPSAYDY